jgi:hypothetical protein
MTKRFLVPILVLSALALTEQAEAQWRAERPYRGLFAGGIGQTSQLLTATASLGTGWSDNLLVDPTGGGNVLPGETGRQFRGGVYTASGVLSYSLNLGAVSFGATGGTTGQYYSSNTRQFVRRDYANVGTSVVVGRGLSVHGSAGYQPYSLRSVFPGLFEPVLGDPSIVDEDFPAARLHYVSYNAGADYSRRLSRRWSMSAGYDYQARPSVEGELGGFKRQTVRARLTRDIGRGLTFHAGYSYSQALYDDIGEDTPYHHVDLGVDYNRALSLSLSRRTVLSFTTGTALYQDVHPKTFRFRVVGSARLSHEIGRTWNASLSYNRGLNFSDTWLEPVFADSMQAGVGGFIGRRTQLRFSASGLLGAGTSSSGSYGDVQSTSANGVLSFALTRHVNTALTYTYYSQQFADTLLLPGGFPHDYDGQSIRASVSVWAPLFQRARRP